jgi:chemotaxis protein MotB
MIGGQLGSMANRAVIEGHTDALQYADSTGYTNWELSVDRANSARREMLAGGLKESQIAEVRGFADRRPRIKLNPTDPRNRRITITVLNDYEIYRYSDTLFVDFNYTF